MWRVPERDSHRRPPLRALRTAGGRESGSSVNLAVEGRASSPALLATKLISRLFSAGDRALESANPFANPFAKFRQLSRPEDQECDAKDHDQVHGLKQSVKHKVPLLFSGLSPC